MKTKLNPTMSHNACYEVTSPSEITFLAAFRFRTDVSLYCISLYFDNATGMYFYAVRDHRSSFRINSVCFHSERNCLADIRSFVAHYVGRVVAREIVPLCLKECA